MREYSTNTSKAGDQTERSWHRYIQHFTAPELAPGEHVHLPRGRAPDLPFQLYHSCHEAETPDKNGTQRNTVILQWCVEYYIKVSKKKNSALDTWLLPAAAQQTADTSERTGTPSSC